MENYNELRRVAAATLQPLFPCLIRQVGGHYPEDQNSNKSALYDGK